MNDLVSISAPSKPKTIHLQEIHLKPVQGGVIVTHHYNGGMPPKQLVFPGKDAMLKHLTKIEHFPWEGSKTGTPRPKGSMQAHRAREIETSGYKGKSLVGLTTPGR